MTLFAVNFAAFIFAEVSYCLFCFEKPMFHKLATTVLGFGFSDIYCFITVC